MQQLARGAGTAYLSGAPEDAVPGESWDELSEHWLTHDQLSPAESQKESTESASAS